MKNKITLTTILLLLFSICLSGQDIHKHYVSRSIGSGMLYFIKPMKLFQSSKNSCYFDQTIKSHNDTVSIGMTFSNKQVFRVDSVVFMNEDTIIGKKVQHLFTEKNKNKWESRFFIFLSKKEMKRFFSDNPPIVTFFGMNASPIQLNTKAKEWKKITKINEAIYQQIDLNE